MDNITFSYIVGILILGFIIYFFMSSKKETLANIDLNGPPDVTPNSKELKNNIKSKLSNQDDLADLLTMVGLRIFRLETTLVNVNKDLEDYKSIVQNWISQNAVTKPELGQTRNDISRIRTVLLSMKDGFNNLIKF